jgi:hypothetical protein
MLYGFHSTEGPLRTTSSGSFHCVSAYQLTTCCFFDNLNWTSSLPLTRKKQDKSPCVGLHPCLCSPLGPVLKLNENDLRIVFLYWRGDNRSPKNTMGRFQICHCKTSNGSKPATMSPLAGMKPSVGANISPVANLTGVHAFPHRWAAWTVAPSLFTVTVFVSLDG